MKIRFKLGKNVFNLVLNGKYNVIIGQSGTGKSLLCDTVETIQSNKTLFNKLTVKMYANPITIRSNIQKAHKAIIFIDEEFPVEEFKVIWDYIKESDNYYIFVSREGYNLVPYGVGTTFILDKSGNEYSMVEYKYDLSSSVKNIRNIITEDEGVGLGVIENIFKSKANIIMTSKGKDNISRKMDEIDKAAILLDLCGIGNRLFAILEKSKRNESFIYETKSFEYEVLKSYFIEYMRNVNYAQDFVKSIKSEEDYYVECLNTVLKNITGLSYNKGSEVLKLLLSNGRIKYNNIFYDLHIPSSRIPIYKSLFERFSNLKNLDL